MHRLFGGIISVALAGADWQGTGLGGWLGFSSLAGRFAALIAQLSVIVVAASRNTQQTSSSAQLLDCIHVDSFVLFYL